MQVSRALVVILFCAVLLISTLDARKRRSGRSKRNHASCRTRSLVRYQLTVKTLWDRETFPKMYPTYRPPAHWSQLIGRSHGAKYRMWQEGGNASLAVERFTTGQDAEVFDLELSQGYNDVLDAFVAPKITRGVGETSAVFTVDASRSKVSFMMGLVPSPDWFIGLDSLDLCYRGRWKKRMQRDLQPFDAGIDQGRTFTSPNWPNDPKEPITAITSSFPDHPASSFFYPEYKVLPTLAKVELEMISEYRLRKVHKEVKAPERNLSEVLNAMKKPIHDSEPLGDNTPTRNDEPRLNQNENIFNSFVIPASSNGNQNKKGSMPLNRQDQKISRRNERAMRSMESDHMRSNLHAGYKKSFESTQFQSSKEGRDRSTKERARAASGASLSDTQLAEVSTQLSLEEYRNSVDCMVSDWSEWSPCSQTCGFGSKQRLRQAIQLPKNGGAICPLLKEESLCGSMRSCRWKHFSFMSSKGKSPFGAMRRRRVRRRRRE